MSIFNSSGLTTQVTPEKKDNNLTKILPINSNLIFDDFLEKLVQQVKRVTQITKMNIYTRNLVQIYKDNDCSTIFSLPTSASEELILYSKKEHSNKMPTHEYRHIGVEGFLLAKIALKSKQAPITSIEDYIDSADTHLIV